MPYSSLEKHPAHIYTQPVARHKLRTYTFSVVYLFRQAYSNKLLLTATNDTVRHISLALWSAMERNGHIYETITASATISKHPRN